MIQSPAELLKALGNNSSRLVVDKANIANQTTGGFSSLWRATGQPGQGAIPTTPAVPTSALLGAMMFTNQTDPVKSYIGWLYLNSSNTGTTPEIHDRLAHMGGLVLNVTTLQTITGMNLATLSVPADRQQTSALSAGMPVPPWPVQRGRGKLPAIRLKTSRIYPGLCVQAGPRT